MLSTISCFGGPAPPVRIAEGRDRMWPQQQLTLSLLVPLLPLLPLLRLLLPVLLVLPPPGVRRLLPRAVRHQVPDLPARAAAAVIGRGSVRQKLSVEKVILDNQLWKMLIEKKN